MISMRVNSNSFQPSLIFSVLNKISIALHSVAIDNVHISDLFHKKREEKKMKPNDKSTQVNKKGVNRE